VPWERINQDSLKTRQKCEAAARTALQLGKNVIIDRCNFDERQRDTWLQIAAEARAPCIALWLHYPQELAAARARDRREHEGNVTGIKGQAISQKMSRLIYGWPSMCIAPAPSYYVLVPLACCCSMQILAAFAWVRCIANNSVAWEGL
jgi:hypothetical protein